MIYTFLFKDFFVIRAVMKYNQNFQWFFKFVKVLSLYTFVLKEKYLIMIVYNNTSKLHGLFVNKFIKKFHISNAGKQYHKLQKKTSKSILKFPSYS